MYLITQEQYRQSKGRVRCGTCRTKFSAVFIEDAENSNQDLEFDTTTVSETGFSEATTQPQDELIESTPTQTSISELSDDFEFDSSLHSELSIDNDTTVSETMDDDPAEGPAVLGAEGSAGGSSSTNPSSDENSRQSDTESHLPTENSAEGSAVLGVEGSLPAEGSLSAEGSSPLSAEGSAEGSLPSDDKSTSTDDALASGELVKQVDELIEEKLFAEVPAAIVAGDSEEKFSLKPSWQHRFKTGTATFCLLTACFILTATLSYQLWFKQALPWPTERQLESIKPLVSPLKEKLAAMQVALPDRRDLSKMELISAQTEIHPTRPSMLLLRVSLFNRAAIDQPLPWLELSLTDEEGRLVSRRALSADDYLYNNNTDNNIRNNELKKVTIELLAFPKNAHGYELKLLNR